LRQISKEEPDLSIEFPARIQVPPVAISELGGLPASGLKAKQEKLDRLEAELEMINAESTAFFASYITESRHHAERLRSLRQFCHQVNETNHRIQKTRDAIDDRKLMLEQFRDPDLDDDHRAIAFMKGLAARVAREQRGVNELGSHVKELRVISEHTEKQFVRRRTKLKARMEKLEGEDREQCERETNIAKLEAQLLTVELRLNECLREALALSGYVQPPEVLQGRNGHWPRGEEIMEIMELVTVDGDE
jgi:DNA repair exonuclease SbcCD ATPase subunit